MSAHNTIYVGPYVMVSKPLHKIFLGDLAESLEAELFPADTAGIWLPNCEVTDRRTSWDRAADGQVVSILPGWVLTEQVLLEKRCANAIGILQRHYRDVMTDWGVVVRWG